MCCDIPEVMVENRLEEMLRQFDMQLRYQDDLQYLQMMGRRSASLKMIIVTMLLRM